MMGLGAPSQLMIQPDVHRRQICVLAITLYSNPTMWGPPRDLSWLTKAPVTIVISTIYHSYWSYKPTLDILGASHCRKSRYKLTCLWGPALWTMVITHKLGWFMFTCPKQVDVPTINWRSTAIVFLPEMWMVTKQFTLWLFNIAMV